MSQVTFQGGAPTGQGSSIVTGLPNQAQPIGVTQDLAIVGTNNELTVGDDIGTLYVGTDSATDVSIATLSPGFDGQRLLVQAITIGGAGVIDFRSDGTGPGKIIDLRETFHSLDIAFKLSTQGDCALLTYSTEGLDTNPPGWYVNQVTNL